MPILSEGYLETIRISMMELFTKIVNCFYLLTIFAKKPVSNVRLDSKYASVSYKFPE